MNQKNGTWNMENGTAEPLIAGWHIPGQPVPQRDSDPVFPVGDTMADLIPFLVAACAEALTQEVRVQDRGG